MRLGYRMTDDDEGRIRLIVREECQAVAAQIVKQLAPLLPRPPDGEGVSLARQIEIKVLAKQVLARPNGR